MHRVVEALAANAEDEGTQINGLYCLAELACAREGECMQTFLDNGKHLLPIICYLPQHQSPRIYGVLCHPVFCMNGPCDLWFQETRMVPGAPAQGSSCIVMCHLCCPFSRIEHTS